MASVPDEADGPALIAVGARTTRSVTAARVAGLDQAAARGVDHGVGGPTTAYRAVENMAGAIVASVPDEADGPALTAVAARTVVSATAARVTGLDLAAARGVVSGAS